MIQVSKEYAFALFELAEENGLQQEYFDALKLIKNEFEKESEYKLLLSSPNIPISERKELIASAFAQYVPEHVLSFVQLLCQNGLIGEFDGCVSEYDELLKAMSKVSTAVIKSAVELSEDQKQKLNQKLCKMSGHKVFLSYEIDPSIMGGMIIYIDDKIIDGSLQTKLTKIKEELDR